MSPKVALKIDINAPIIKIPINSLSDGGVIVDLGSLVIRNKLEYREMEKSEGESKAVLLDNINVTLDSFNVVRFVVSCNPICDEIIFNVLNFTSERQLDFLYIVDSIRQFRGLLLTILLIQQD